MNKLLNTESERDRARERGCECVHMYKRDKSEVRERERVSKEGQETGQRPRIELEDDGITQRHKQNSL